MKKTLLLSLLVLFTYFFKAQNCIHPNEIITSATTTIDQSGYTNVTGCQNAGQYAVCDFTAAGTYTISGFGGFGTDYITFTTNSNTVILSGSSPLIVTVSSAGLYRIHLSSNSSCASDAFCHSVSVIGATPSAPGNDLCSSAATLAVPGNTNGTTANATSETLVPSSCSTSYNNEAGVWYTVTGNGNKIGASLCSSNWDSKIFVYAGSCGSLTCITGNDNNGPLCISSAASATWCSAPGMNYFILVAGTSSTGSFVIDITQTVTTVPAVTLTASGTTLCAGQTATLSATGASTYSWNTGATTSSIAVNPTVSTSYTVTGYSSNNCAMNSKMVTINVSPCTGLASIHDQETAISVYPNPVNKNVTIRSENTEERLTVELINSLGEIVLRDSGKGLIIFHLENYSSGIYIVRMSINGRVYYSKILKQ
jgi:hypothetical protein